MTKLIKSKKSSRKDKKRTSKNQKGGVSSSNSCVLDYATQGLSNHTNSSALANLHNLNPQAAGDLDNKFMLYGGPVPLGQMGGSKCGDEGVGTNKPKSSTFKQYINTIDNQLNFSGGSKHSNHEKHDMHKGGDYSVNPEQYIAGNPVINGYDHNNPPAIIDGKLIMSGNIKSGGGVNRQVCGNGATRGGSIKSKSKSKSKSNTKRKTHKTKLNKKQNSKSKMQKGIESHRPHDEHIGHKKQGHQPTLRI